MGDMDACGRGAAVGSTGDNPEGIASTGAAAGAVSESDVGRAGGDGDWITGVTSVDTGDDTLGEASAMPGISVLVTTCVLPEDTMVWGGRVRVLSKG